MNGLNIIKEISYRDKHFYISFNNNKCASYEINEDITVNDLIKIIESI